MTKLGAVRSNQAHRALRDRTGAAHARVDTVFAGFDLSDRTAYAAMLAAHAEVLLPAEAALDAAGAQACFPDWPERRRGQLLGADLAALAPPYPAAPPERVEGRWNAPAPARALPDDKPGASGTWGVAGSAERVAFVAAGARPGPPAIAGALYVLEGSRLGGRFLARSLPADFPRFYLDSDQPTEKWRELLFKLESILYLPEALSCAVDAALGVFDAFETAGRKWLAKV